MRYPKRQHHFRVSDHTRLALYQRPKQPSTLCPSPTLDGREERGRGIHEAKHMGNE